MKLFIYDTEATGLKDNQLCQISALIVDGASVRGVNRYYTVDGMNEAALRVHGLSLDTLRALSGGRRFGEDAAFWRDLIAGCALVVGHNVPADQKVLSCELTRAGLSMPPVPTLCTMKAFTRVMNQSRKYQPDHPKPPRLCELYAFYDLTDETVARWAGLWFGGGEHVHDARFDAAATWLSLREGIMRGDVSLKDALSGSHHTTKKRHVNARPARRVPNDPHTKGDRKRHD